MDDDHFDRFMVTEGQTSSRILNANGPVRSSNSKCKPNYGFTTTCTFFALIMVRDVMDNLDCYGGYGRSTVFETLI